MPDDNRLARFQIKVDEQFGEGYQVLTYTYVKEPCSIRCLSCGEVRNFMRADGVLRNEKLCICRTGVIQRGKYEEKIKNKYNEDIRFLKFEDVKKPCTFICCKCYSIDSLKYAENIMVRDHICRHCFPGGIRGGTSNGELAVEDFLIENNYNYIKQYPVRLSPKDNRDKRFDFAIMNKNNTTVLMMIEFNGKQHYVPSNLFGGEKTFERIKKSDQMKVNYCRNNNIPFLQINYEDIDIIDEILADFINENSTKTFNDYRNHVNY